MIFHVVRSGETLNSIALTYGTTVDALIRNNGMPNPNNLAVGQCVVVVYPQIVHTVSPGDTIFSIAERYGVSVNALYRNNPQLLSLPDISVGEDLVVKFEDEPIGDFKTGGYSYPYIEEALLIETMPFLNYLMPFTYGFTPEGNLIVLDDSRLLSAAFTYGVTPFLHLSTLTEDGVFSNTLAGIILNDPAAQDALIENATNEIIEKGYGGLDIDFEFLPAADALRYADFIRKARETLNPLGYEVIAALAPKVSDNQAGLLYEGHNYAAIGEAANYVLIMSYEWGYTYGPPMAVSPIPSMRRVLNYAVSRIPHYKIFMGVSNYGYDWPLPYVKGTTRAESISTDTALILASENRAEIFFDETAKAPYFYYTDASGVVHEVWFEDARSIAAKLELCAEFGFRGVLDWNIDRRNRQNLLMMNLIFLGGR